MKLICIIKGDEWRGNLQCPLVLLLKHKLKREKWLQEPFRGCEPDGRSAETRPLYLFVRHNIDAIRRMRPCTKACKSNQSGVGVELATFKTHTHTHICERNTPPLFRQYLHTNLSVHFFLFIHPSISPAIRLPSLQSAVTYKEFHYSLVKQHFCGCLCVCASACVWFFLNFRIRTLLCVDSC